MYKKEILVNYFGYKIHEAFSCVSNAFFEDIEEIRLRVDKPVVIYKKGEELSISENGEILGDIHKGYITGKDDIKKTLELMSGYSLYAFEEELKYGYLTLQGGHRVGLTGRVVSENNRIVTIKNINGINIRVSHEVVGCSDSIIGCLTNPVRHTMIISPPACGKTTLLRDIVRNISSGNKEFLGQTVGVVDERSEIGGCYRGIPQNDIGDRTDILDACPKALGMSMLLRTMSPKVIAVDEIGSKDDVYAIEEVINAGVKIICTVHGKNIDELLTKPALGNLIRQNIFERYVILGYEGLPGKVFAIYDKNLNQIA